MNFGTEILRLIQIKRQRLVSLIIIVESIRGVDGMRVDLGISYTTFGTSWRQYERTMTSLVV